MDFRMRYARAKAYAISQEILVENEPEDSS